MILEIPCTLKIIHNLNFDNYYVFAVMKFNRVIIPANQMTNDDILEKSHFSDFSLTSSFQVHLTLPSPTFFLKIKYNNVLSKIFKNEQLR